MFLSVGTGMQCFILGYVPPFPSTRSKRELISLSDSSCVWLIRNDSIILAFLISIQKRGDILTEQCAILGICDSEVKPFGLDTGTVWLWFPGYSAKFVILLTGCTM